MFCRLALLVLQLHASSAFEPEVSIFDPHQHPQEWYVLTTGENSYTVNALTPWGTYSSNDFGINWSTLSRIYEISTVAGSPNKIRYHDFFRITFDGGLSFQNVPLPPGFSLFEADSPDTLMGHPTQNDWLIFNTDTCDNEWKHCQRSSYVTTDRGSNWKAVKSGGRGHRAYCYFVTASDYVVYCENFDDELDYTPDFREFMAVNASAQRPFEVDAKDNFVIRQRHASIEDYIQEDQTAVSRDGINFRQAELPQRLRQENEKLKIIDGKSEVLFASYGGKLLRSGKLVNEFTTVLDHLNGAFDKIPSMEGVYIATIDSPKKSVISHDGGTTWKPVVGSDGQELLLDLDPHANTAFVNTAGVYIAVGSIRGQERFRSTFMTRDAGKSWFQIHGRAALWAVADQGSVIAMVVETHSDFDTDHIYYTFDYGQTWQEYSWGFKAYVKSLIGAPDGGSSRFIIAIEDVEHEEGEIFRGQANHVYTLNFATDDAPYCDASDFETWEPEYPELTSKCVLGKKTIYRRRIQDRKCLIGSYLSENKVSEVKESCECTRADYECDYTHELDSASDECKPIAGAHMPTKEEQCVNGSISWKNFTGYRKIAATSCHGDPIEDSTRLACPGKEKEFSDGVFDVDTTLRRKPNKTPFILMWIGISFAILAVVVTLLVLIILYRHHIKRLFKLRSDHIPLDAGSTSGSSQKSAKPGLWRRIKARLPFFGSQLSEDSLGFYSRMNNEERDRIVQEYEIGDLNDSQNDDDDTVASSHESELS